MADLRAWVPDEAIEQLTVRRALQAQENSTALAADLLREALPLATLAMTHLAIHSQTEAIRFQASKYIMDKTLGDGRDARLPNEKRAWDQIYENVLVEAEEAKKAPTD